MEKQKDENDDTIYDIYSVIDPHIPCDRSEILSIEYARPKYVDRYGLKILKLTIQLINTTTGEDWTLQAITKTLPEYTVSHNIDVIKTTLKNELGLYMKGRHAIYTFLKEKGMDNVGDFFLTFCGGRFNLKGTNEVDRNAVLVLRDFRFMGYKIVHRRTGFDLDTTKLILATLAKFHGSTIGLKINKPKEFKDKIRPYLGKSYTVQAYEKSARSHLIKILKGDGFLPSTIERAVSTFDRRLSEEVREPWATFTHGNSWVNNIPVRFDKNRRPLDVKLKGLQESEYDSPLRDVLFFLFSSVQLVVLKEYLDELIDFYYYNFFNTLRQLRVEIKSFSRPLFNQELKAAASKSEFYKTVCMLYPILGTSLELSSIIVDDDCVPEITDPLHINRLCYIVREFDKRGWLSF